jgi:hypothetical protein
MKFNFSLLLTIFILLMFSCKDTEKSVLRDISFQDGKIAEINLDNIPVEVREFKLSELFSDFQTIPLETRPECVIGNTKISFSKDFIFVGTQNFPGASKLYRFNKNGSFINEYGKEGRGPGEHEGYLPSQVIPFEEDSLLLVNWQGNDDNSQYFSLNGFFKGEVILPMELLSEIYNWSDKEWFSFGNCAGKPEFQRDSCKLVFFNDQGKILKTIPRLKYPNTRTEDFTPYGGLNSIFKFNNQWKIYIPGVDTIFKLVDKNLIPTDILNRGKNGMPYNSIMAPEELTGKFDLKILAETDNNLFIQKYIIKSVETNQYKPGKWSVSIMPEYQLIIIDKKSRKATYVKLIDDIFQFLSDDFLNSRLEWTDNPKVYISVQAMAYLKAIKESKPVDGLTKEALSHRDKLKGITENSNPIILTFSLKERIRID